MRSPEKQIGPKTHLPKETKKNGSLVPGDTKK